MFQRQASVFITALVVLAVLGKEAAAATPPAAPVCDSTASCPTGSRCMAFKSCRQGHCTCLSGWRQDTSAATFTCVQPSQNLTQSCTRDSDCTGTNTACVSNVCACATSYKATDAVNCGPLPLGAQCAGTPTPYVCGQWAMCNSSSGICQCQPGYKEDSSDSTNCSPLSPNDPCTVTDCPSAACPYATCQSGTYQCNSGYSFANTGFHWITLNWMMSYRECVPNNATKNVAEGQSCDDQQPYYKVCSSSGFRGCRQACPENNGQATCVGPSAELTVPITAPPTNRTPSHGIIHNVSAVTLLAALLLLLLLLL